ncbi:MAG TPA: tryptophan synthase subunit alpha, partial [candidate division Zixibacteria bacterium]|nr:tryptophan synthase subunit alpha [candidate division Zixibacteria bacterium]
DMLEIGAPFSDPLADGPAIQFSSQQALAKGLNLDGLFELVRRVRAQTAVPLLLMGYYNPLLALGVEKYLRTAADAGASGLIIPDLPPDEAGAVRSAARELGLSLVFLVAPTSTPGRIALVDRSSTDFVYAVTVAGVTGARDALTPETVRYLRGLRRRLSKPFVAGFGVSTPAMAAQLGALADGVVVGSALVETIRRAAPQAAPAAVARSVRALRRALDSVS